MRIGDIDLQILAFHCMQDFICQGQHFADGQMRHGRDQGRGDLLCKELACYLVVMHMFNCHLLKDTLVIQLIIMQQAFQILRTNGLII